jgi:TolB-like protein/class 3 adenylate cyclase/Tfp pilus assembly protein PilF
MSAQEQRKLAAIMFTDMVGYSALSQRDEKLAQELLEEHRRLLREIFPRFNGTEIKTIGDAFLVEFGSALEAAQCAIEIQRTLAKRNADIAPDRRIELKIGVHIGDVVHRGGDVYGDGVNIASRIEPVAGPGGICVSMDVERQVRNALEARFEKLAPTELKNISVAMDLFRIVLPWERNARLTDERQKHDVRQQRSIPIGWIAAAVLLLVVIGAGVFVFQRQKTKVAPRQDASPARTEAATASTIPEKSIAVLPFENLSEEKANAFFADGVQDEILTDLAKIADLKVISRTSVMQYKSGLARNLRKIGEELGVAHVVEGSVQRAANKVRVNAQLIDARTDAHLWAQTYDRDLADVFAIQSEIAKAIADQLQAKLSPNEKTAIEERPTNNIAAFDEYSRAKTLLLTTGFNVSQRTNYLQAVDNLNSAIARDPSFFEAYYQLAHANDSLYALLDHTPARLAQAETALQGAARLRPDAPETHLARASHLYFALRDYKTALAELEIARRGLTNDPRIYELTGYILRRQGKHEEGLRDLKHAVELDPQNPETLAQLALSYQFLRRWPDMAAVLDRALAITPDDIETRMQRGLVDFLWKADPRPLHQAIERVRAEQPASIAHAADNWFIGALAERDWAGAEQALAALGDNPFWGDGTVLLSRHFGEGLLARAMHDDAKAAEAFAAARLEQEQLVERQKDYGPALCALGLIDAGLGKKGVALEEGKRAMELMPVEKDSINGQRMQIYFAIIAAWVGEKDLALQQLALAGPTPGACLIASYGSLKLLPFWDPLRGDPRFEKIVASLAPKEPAPVAK